MITTGAPEPTSTSFNTQLPTTNPQHYELSNYPTIQLITQRLARFQRMRHPLLRLPLGDEAQKGFAFEVQQVLLGNRGCMRQRAAGHDRGQLPSDDGIVIADTPRAMRQMDAELERRGNSVAADRNGAAGHGWLVTLTHALQCPVLCVRQQPLAIHRVGICRP